MSTRMPTVATLATTATGASSVATATMEVSSAATATMAAAMVAMVDTFSSNLNSMHSVPSSAEEISRWLILLHSRWLGGEMGQFEERYNTHSSLITLKEHEFWYQTTQTVCGAESVILAILLVHKN